jgi:hypothetical protein
MHRTGKQSAERIGIERAARTVVERFQGEQVHYSRKEEPRAVAAACVDKGARIAIHDLQRDSVLAALRLPSAKWKRFTVSGSAASKALAVSLAVEHGFKISNPELQGAIVQGRAERHAAARVAEAPAGPTAAKGRARDRTPQAREHSRRAEGEGALGRRSGRHGSRYN